MPHDMKRHETSDAVYWLRKAIDLHERHLKAKKPPSDASQKELMYDLESALEELDPDA